MVDCGRRDKDIRLRFRETLPSKVPAKNSAQFGDFFGDRKNLTPISDKISKPCDLLLGVFPGQTIINLLDRDDAQNNFSLIGKPIHNFR